MGKAQVIGVRRPIVGNRDCLSPLTCVVAQSETDPLPSSRSRLKRKADPSAQPPASGLSPMGCFFRFCHFFLNIFSLTDFYFWCIVLLGYSCALFPYRRHLASAFAFWVAQALLPVHFTPLDPNPFECNTYETCTILVQIRPVKSFRMNTCKSVSKQKTSSAFRMNTYAKTQGGGVLLLTKFPAKRLHRHRPSPIFSIYGASI
jgi:hypothetical protein